jgi:hypothetical protein
MIVRHASSVPILFSEQALLREGGLVLSSEPIANCDTNYKHPSSKRLLCFRDRFVNVSVQAWVL